MAVSRSSAAFDLVSLAPERQAPHRPNKHATVQPHLVEQKRPMKSRSQRFDEATHTLLRSVKIVAVSVCLLIMLSMLIFERAQLIGLESKKASLEDKLGEVKSDTVRLEAEFNRRVSVGNVEDYAKNELGMIKRQKYQIHFFDNDGVDEIIIPGLSD